jgi:hypothetical protein
MFALLAWLRTILRDHPDVLLGLLIPPAHYVWNRYNIHNRKRSLRQRIAELIAQRESLAKVASLPHGDNILQDLENDLKATMAELVPVCVSADVHRKLSLRRDMARWFLVYKPSGGLAWILHGLFFLNIAIVLLGILGSVTPWNADSPAGLLGCALFLIPAYFLHWMARRVERARSGWPGSL